MEEKIMDKETKQYKEKTISGAIFDFMNKSIFMIIAVLVLSLIIFNNSEIIATIIFILSCGYVYFKFVKKDDSF